MEELVEDSGDEKQLEKAERAAELKAPKQRNKKVSSAQSCHSCSPSVPAAAVHEPAPLNHIPSLNTRRFTSMMAPTPASRVVDRCFTCGEMGHMCVSSPRIAVRG